LLARCPLWLPSSTSLLARCLLSLLDVVTFIYDIVSTLPAVADFVNVPV
jgi:hypothetical protein